MPVSRWLNDSLASAVTGWTSFTALLASFFLIDEFSRFPGYVALLPVISTAIVLAGGQNERGPNGLLRNALLQFFGTRSYAIYLWHWPVFVLGSALFESSPLTMSLYFGLTVALSSLSFIWLEQPIRSNRWMATGRVRSVALGLALTFAGAALGSLVFVNAARSTSPSQANILDVTSKLAVAAENQCLVGFLDSAPARCVFGASNYKRTLVLFGDSHAEQWSTALSEIADREGWRLITYLKASCPVSNIEVYNMRLRRFSPECAIWRRQAIAQIIAERPNAILITQFSSAYIKGDITNLGRNAVDLGQWKSGLIQTLADLQSAHAPIFLLRDNPTPRHPVGSCLARADWRGQAPSKCGRDLKSALNDNITLAEKSAAAGFPNITSVDFTPEICVGDQCPPIKDSIIVYRDANHLTVDFTLHSAKIIETLDDKLFGRVDDNVSAIGR